jgi:hypothetical protein
VTEQQFGLTIYGQRVFWPFEVAKDGLQQELIVEIEILCRKIDSDISSDLLFR